MAKARGLPDNYKLNISQAAIGQKPVELGDYLDEDDERKPARPAAESPPPAAEIPAQQPPPAAVPEPPRPALHVVPQVSATPRPQPVAQAMPARMRGSVPRKQVNMTPETLAMLDQLLDFVQTYSVQKDLKGSELFHALVLALFEARQNIDLSRVQPRGRWGTPTAAALPIALKNAFQKAVRDFYETQNPPR
jgi:hypothetical protein